MMNSVLHFVGKTYLKNVKTATVFGGTTGILSGIYANGCNDFESEIYKNDASRCAIKVYTNLIGYTSLGLITGITYPISFPLCIYFLYTTK